MTRSAKTKSLVFFTALGLSLNFPDELSAQTQKDSYPSRTVTLVVPFAPGGPPDVIARITASKMTTLLGQPVIVDNRPSAGGIRAAEAVANASPNGYVLMVASTSHWALTPLLFKNISYDPFKNFAPVARLATFDSYLVVTNDVPGDTLKDILAAIKANPSKYSYGSPGTGSIPNLQFELMKSVFGLDVVHIPYKGGNGIVQGLLGREVAVGFVSAQNALILTNSKKGRIVAIASASRSSTLPDIPTFEELGYADFNLAASLGILTTAGTPLEIIAKLESTLIKITEDSEFQELARSSGGESAPATGEQLLAIMKRDSTRYKKAADLVGLQPQ
jgi:tripartite-type tricarboxylate transporter receptor subunit TctC